MIEARKKSVRGETRQSRVLDVQSISLTGLFVLASVWFLHQAQEFVVPLTVALLLHFLLMPIVRWFKRRRIAEPIAAAIILLAVTGLVALTFYELGEPAAQWLEKAPRAMRILQEKLLPVKDSMAQITAASDAIDRIGQTDSEGAVGARSASCDHAYDGKRYGRSRHHTPSPLFLIGVW
jgi:predicted PurR-regulated permease PerM